MSWPPLPLDTNRTDDGATEGVHTQDHNDAHIAINDIVAELGLNPSGSYDDLTTRLNSVDSTLASKMKYILPDDNEYYTATTTSYSDVDATVFTESIVPKGETVIVKLSAYVSLAPDSELFWSVRVGTSDLTYAKVLSNISWGTSIVGMNITLTLRITGLTIGDEYVLKWGHKVGATGQAARIDVGPGFGPAVMEIISIAE